MAAMTSRRRVSWYVAGVAVMAGAGFVYDVISSWGKGFGSHPAAFWLLAGCALITELMPLRWLAVDNRGEVTSDWTFLMAMLLIAPPMAAVGVTAFLFLLADLRAGKPALKVVFNVSDIVLSLSLGAVILGVTHQAAQLDLGGQPDLVWFPMAAVAICVVFATNTLLTCGAIGLNAGVSTRAILRDHGTDALPTDAMLLALAPIFVVTAERSLLLVPPLIMTTAIVYRTARLSLSRRYDSTHDLLTGVANRRLLDQHLQRSIESALSRGEMLALVLVDLDGFKAVNDNLGHQVGDQVLIEVAGRLNRACRAGDLLARLGGDEFAVVLSSVDSVEGAEAAAWRIINQFDHPIEIEGVPLEIGASAGVAVLPMHGQDRQSLLRHADEAMYSAKHERDTVRVYGGHSKAAAIGRLGLLNDLGNAIENDELFLEYQPQVELATLQTVGVEALIRWRHPTVGVIPPGVFMPLAEQTELIGEITEFVMRRGLTQLASWRSEGRLLNLAINVSVRNAEDPAFPPLVERLLLETDVPPGAVTLELTESAAALERTRITSALNALRDIGVAISIDDFCTGYSSLGQLRDLPVDQVKLDRSFVGSMADDARDALIVKGIVSLARSLGMNTVAEGVEDELVAGLLRDLGCDQAQGFLYARPMSEADLVAWLRRQPLHDIPEFIGLDDDRKPVFQ